VPGATAFALFAVALAFLIGALQRWL